MIQIQLLNFIDWLFNTKENNKSNKCSEWYRNNKLIYCRR